MSRILPHSTDAEKAVLGALMQFSNSMRDAMDQGLQPTDFFVENHARIFEAMLDLYNANQVVDIRTVTTKLALNFAHKKEHGITLAGTLGMPKHA
mgnify:CR=1 FL=1